MFLDWLDVADLQKIQETHNLFVCWNQRNGNSWYTIVLIGEVSQDHPMANPNFERNFLVAVLEDQIRALCVDLYSLTEKQWCRVQKVCSESYGQRQVFLYVSIVLFLKRVFLHSHHTSTPLYRF